MFFRSIRNDPFEKIIEEMGDRRHHWLTLTVVLNHSTMLPFFWTALVTLLKSCSVVRTGLTLILFFRMVAHKATYLSFSNAFFVVSEDMAQILLMLEVLFTQL